MEAHELKPLKKRRTEAEQDRRAVRRALRKTGWKTKAEPIRIYVRMANVFNHRATQSKQHSHVGEIARRARAEARRRA